MAPALLPLRTIEKTNGKHRSLCNKLLASWSLALSDWPRTLQRSTGTNLSARICSFSSCCREANMSSDLRLLSKSTAVQFWMRLSARKQNGPWRVAFYLLPAEATAIVPFGPSVSLSNQVFSLVFMLRPSLIFFWKARPSLISSGFVVHAANGWKDMISRGAKRWHHFPSLLFLSEHHICPILLMKSKTWFILLRKSSSDYETYNLGVLLLSFSDYTVQSPNCFLAYL